MRRVEVTSVEELQAVLSGKGEAVVLDMSNNTIAERKEFFKFLRDNAQTLKKISKDEFVVELR